MHVVTDAPPQSQNVSYVTFVLLNPFTLFSQHPLFCCLSFTPDFLSSLLFLSALNFAIFSSRSSIRCIVSSIYDFFSSSPLGKVCFADEASKPTNRL